MPERIQDEGCGGARDPQRTPLKSRIWSWAIRMSLMFSRAFHRFVRAVFED